MRYLLPKSWSKILFISSICIVVFVALVFMRAFFLMDLSKAPLENQITAPVYLISYADGPEVFHKNRKMLVYSGLQKGVSHFFNYKKDMIDPKFLEKHKDTFSKKHGAGYWIWKPWVIQDALKKIPENAYVFYCDSGFVFKGDVSPILDLLKTKDMVLMTYTNKELYGPLSKTTKEEAFIKTGCDTQECRNFYLLWAGMIFMKNTPATRSFIQKWLTYCEDPELLGPESKYLPSRHNYDQSLLGVAYYKNPQHIALVPEEEIADNNIFRWHHRHSSRESESLFFDYEKIRGVERRVINNGIFKTLAKWVYKFSESKPSEGRSLTVISRD